MKWYDRQKQLYAQKSNEHQAPQETSYSPAEEPVMDDIQTTYEEQTSYQEASQYEEDTQLDEMMDETLQDYDNQDEVDDFSTMTPLVQSEDATTIAKGTILTGNIESDEDLIIHGHIKGDIICNANLSIFGVVEGTINCNNAYFDNALIAGDVGCSGGLQLTQSSTVHGNVEAYDLLNGGHIKGNVVVEESIKFTTTSAIVGDVVANDIEVERGAVIQGNVTIRQEVYFEGK